MNLKNVKVGATGVHPQKDKTCWFMMAEELKFLTEDDE